MRQIKHKNGIVLLEICDEYLLVSTKEARKDCPYVTQINKTAAECWKELEYPVSINQLVENIAYKLNKEKKELLLPIILFIEKMRKAGYLEEERDDES